MITNTCMTCGKPCDPRARYCGPCSNTYFLPGHIPWNKGIKTERKPHNWKGGRIKSGKYIHIHMPQHHRATKRGYVLEHILICERVLGKPLPVGAEIHHVDGNGSNNQNSNLIICQDRAYHMLLHIKEHALKACGNSSWRRCSICKKHDSVDNLVYRNRNSRNGDSYHHNSCRKLYRKYGSRWIETNVIACPFVFKMV